MYAASPAYSEEPTHRTITVSGTATVRYVPDAAKIQFRIRNSEATWDDVRQSNQKALKLVDEKLSALKIKDLKITFSPMNTGQSSAMARGRGPGAPVAEARNVNSTQLVTLIVREADLDRLTESIAKIEKSLFDAGFVNGPAVDDDMPVRAANNLSVSMFRRDEAEFREEALTKAVQNAMQKAKALARGAGVQIKDTISIVENEASPSDLPVRTVRNSPNGPGGGGFGGPSTITILAPQSSTGELEVTVRVTVKCAY
jgi:hypothetical protein